MHILQLSKYKFINEVERWFYFNYSELWLYKTLVRQGNLMIILLNIKYVYPNG